MTKKIAVRAGISLISLLTVLPIYAQEVATLALRNGERPSGELIDLGGGGFVLRINGQDRTVATGDVAAVEFVVGPASAEAQRRIDAGQPFVVLRNGQVIDGRLSDIGGTHPLRITIDTAGGPRDFTSTDVAQIYVNPAPRAVSTAGQATAPAPTTAATAPAGAIVVAANQQWTDTGITVGRGQRFAFTATGDVMTSASASSGPGGSPAATVASSRYPVQGAPVGALIGRVGNSAPFLIGLNTEPILLRAAGRLFLAVNDDALGDNSGNYWVTVTRVR